MTNNRLENGTVARDPGFTQVCIWPGTVVGSDYIDKFVAVMAAEFDGVRVQYLEEIKTKPDKLRGVMVADTGGRTDVFFAVHEDDLQKFAIPRLKAGIRWFEDVISNERSQSPDYSIYPDYVMHYWSWAIHRDREEVSEEIW